MTTQLAYQDPDACMTLGEGLAEYHSRIPGLLDPASLSPDAAALFRVHDLCHVVFGCDTSAEQELELKTWSLFGTTLGWRDYLRYLRSAEVRGIGRTIARSVGPWTILRVVLGGLTGSWRTFWRCRRMSRRWPAQKAAPYLDRPLRSIRAEFNIVLPRRRGPGAGASEPGRR
jgi:hypothetical protein